VRRAPARRAPLRGHQRPRAHGCSTAARRRSALETARGGTDEKRERLVFEKQMELLSDRARVFDGDVFLELLAGMKDASGMSGVREHLPWVQNNPALGEIKDQQAVVHAMAPAERRRVTEIGIAAKKRVARATGQSLDAIEAVISQIGTMRRIQQWLARREDVGKPAPGSSQALQAMLAAPDSGMSRKPDRGAKAGRPRPGVKQRRR
jgi:signal recognition particle GTPase